MDISQQLVHLGPLLLANRSLSSRLLDILEQVAGQHGYDMRAGRDDPFGHQPARARDGRG
jgi:hypothetical protein